MKKTFVTVVPNHIGAFLKATRCFSDLGINLTRVSYNKAVDSHCLFIDAEGSHEQLMKAQERLEKIGYLHNPYGEKSAILLEFRLPDYPGSVTPLLELIESFGMNISFISSQENGTGYQLFKMGYITDDFESINRFREEASKICDVRVLEYNRADRILDNSVFYSSFVSQLADIMHLGDDIQEKLLVNVNLAMQELDETGVSPYRTFDNISRCAESLSQARGEHFVPRITRSSITQDTEIILIEPPCGSNTAILISQGEYLFIDTGLACYKEEMYSLLRRLIPEFDWIEKNAFITHADLDHCGLLPFFDHVYASQNSAKCLYMEATTGTGYREQNRMHQPYITICKELTMYKPTSPEKVTSIGGTYTGDQLFAKIGEFQFADLSFNLYEGKGGHLTGETVMIDEEHHLVFSGDILINMKGMIPAQAKYNRYAPILMTSVDSNQKLCAEERAALLGMLGDGTWHIFGGHGAEIKYTSDHTQEAQKR